MAFLGEGGLEAEADGIGESFVLFLGLVEFLLGQALKLGDGGVVVALHVISSAPVIQTRHGKEIIRYVHAK